MLHFSRILLTFTAVLVAAAPALAQLPDLTERPKLHVPVRPPTQQELDSLEAMHLFAEGVMCQQQDRFLEAMQAYEKAAKLDPRAVTIHKSLLMIYIAVERHQDAARLLKLVLELDSGDFEMSYLYARLLRNQGRPEEAQAVLKKGLQSSRLHDRPDLHQQMEYDLGALHESMQQYQAAASAFERAAAVLDHPDGQLEMFMSAEEIQMRSADTHERVGKNYLDARLFDKAVAAFETAQSRFPPGAGRLYYNLAQIHLRQGNLAEAATSLSSYLKMLPQGTDAYDLMLGIMQMQKRDAEIVPWLEQASSQDTFNVGLRLLLARQCVRAGQIAKAEKIYCDMAAATPTEQIYREIFVLAKDHYPTGPKSVAAMINDTLEAAGRKDGLPAAAAAPAQARAMIGALRDNPALVRDVLPGAVQLAKNQPLHSDTDLIFATLADQQGLLPEAEFFYGECLKQPLSAATEPVVYGGLLRVLWKAQRFEAIVSLCRLGLTKTQASNKVLIRADLARALGQLQRWKEALQEVDEAVREADGDWTPDSPPPGFKGLPKIVGKASDPERFAVRILRVRLLTQADKFTEAEAECRALLKDHMLPGEQLEIHYLLSGIFSYAKRPQEAEAELYACLKIDATNVAVNNDLGYLLADENKNLAEAETMIRLAIELDRKSRQGLVMFPPQQSKQAFKDNACYIDSLGWVLFRRGQLEEARKQLDYATTLPDGDDPVIWDHLGEVRMALGQTQQALADWRQALHFYEEGKHRKIDERYRLLQQRLKAAGGK